MSRPTRLVIEPSALLHNVLQIKNLAPGKQVVAMVKANAYGCGIREVAPVLEGVVDAFGVACIEEAMNIRSLGVRTECILFQGIFSPDELSIVSEHHFSCVVHTFEQLEWIKQTTLTKPIKLWVKVNTGMHRLGFKAHDLQQVMAVLKECSWVDKDIGLMTHMACADEPDRYENQEQISLFHQIKIPGFTKRSIANSAAIISLKDSLADVVRPGIMLYGVSPFVNQTARELGLIPVMRFMSAVSAIHHNPSNAQVGYGGTWKSDKPSRIGIVAAGYGDGYPRHISANTPVWLRGREVMIVGRVSMDMLAVDLTEHPEVEVGDEVELWGANILVERIAKSAGTIGYELLCQISERVRGR